HDGAGRTVVVYTTDGGSDPTPGEAESWSNAQHLDGDTVLQQAESQYDGVGNVIFTTTRQRLDNAVGFGSLGDATSTVQPAARVSYSFSYYDAINRPVTVVNIGTNGGSLAGAHAGVTLTAAARPSSAPDRSPLV